MKDHANFWESKVNKALSNDSHPTKYPYDLVVTFVFRNYPRDKDRSDTKILEVGCAGGNNLYFCAKEGFDVYGIDYSPTSIEYAQQRFTEDGLTGNLAVGNLTELPFDDATFDLVIDRAAITCNSLAQATVAVNEIHRCLNSGGKFLFNAYSDAHTSMTSGEQTELGTMINMTAGSIAGFDGVYFFSRSEVGQLFSEEKWHIQSLDHMESVDKLTGEESVHSEWRVIVEKI